jgi:uncharacterized protein (DUF433 family)
MMARAKGPVEIAPGITVDSGVRFGKPVIKGTRVDVATVLEQLALGVTHEELVREFRITEQGIRAALQYAADIVASERVSA